MLQMEAEVMTGMRMNQNSEVLGQTSKTSELDDTKMLHRAERDCRVWWANLILH